MKESNMEKIVKEYLKKVKEKLPDWLKKENKEYKEILNELEEHIWDKAEELSEFEQPTEESVAIAIEQMGTPESIAKEYKRRGTPKIYISEELWPLYKKWLLGVFFVIIALNVIGLIISVITEDSIDFNIFSQLLWVFAIITGIFIYLSMEGYFPEDFKSKNQLEKEKIELAKAKKEGRPLNRKTGKPLKPIVIPGEKIFGGICILIFGIILILQPFGTVKDMIHTDFLTLVLILGIFLMIEGFLLIIRGILGNENIVGQQVTLILYVCLQFAYVWLFVLLMNRPEIFPIIIDFGVDPTYIDIITIPVEYHDTYRNIWLIIIVFVVIDSLYQIYKAGSFEKYKKK